MIGPYAGRFLVPGLDKKPLRVRLFEKKITTFDIGTKKMLEFQNVLETTVTFCVTRVVCTCRWTLRPRKSQGVVYFSKWHAYKFSLRTQTQPSSMHQLGVKNTPITDIGTPPQTMLQIGLVSIEKLGSFHLWRF
jgi:hypothetical protein